jgi:hypothetical protein
MNEVCCWKRVCQDSGASDVTDIRSVRRFAVTESRLCPRPPRAFRPVIQRVGDDHLPSFRVIAYGEVGGNARVEFSSLRALLDALDAAVPDVVLDLWAEGSIVFS